MWNNGGHRYNMMDGGGGWMMLGATVTVALLIVGLTVLVTLLLHARRPVAATTAPAADAARVALDLRLARGEVTQEEYASVRSILERT